MMTLKVVGIAVGSVASLAASTFVGYRFGQHKQAEVDLKAMQEAVDVTAEKYEKIIDEMEAKNTTASGIRFHRFAASFINMNGDKKEFRKFLDVLVNSDAITKEEKEDIYQYCTCGKMELEAIYAASKKGGNEDA